MKNLKFKTRLIIGYSIVIVLSLFIGIIGLNQIKRIGNDSDLIYNHPLKVGNAVRDINVNINAIHRLMNDASNSNNKKQLTPILGQINRHDSIIIEAFSIVNARFLGDKSIVENTRELYKESRTIREKVFETKINGTNLEAVKILKSEGIKHKELLFIKTKKLTDFAQNKADEFYKSTVETRQNSLIIISSVTFLLLIISLITAVLISSSILKPIHKFIVDVKKVFNDNKYLDIKYNNNSEQKVFENTVVEIRNAYEYIADQKLKLEKFNKELDQKVEERTKKLLISEELNRSITQSANDAIISIDSEGKILTWNGASEKIFGFKAFNMIGENLHKLVPEKYLEGHEERLDRLRNGEVEKLIGKTIEISAIGKNGIEFPIELSLSNWKSDNNNYYTGIIRDITERKKNKEALLESKNRFETLIQQAGDAIFLADFNGNIIEVNNTACESLGYTREELLSLKISDIDGNYSHIKEQRDFWENLKNNKSQTIETIHIKKNGEKLEVEINLGLFKIDNKKAILGFSRNISTRKQNEKELIEAKEKAEENNSLKTKFLNNLSHEIRTPMNGILGFSQFLSDPNISNEKRSYFVNIIQSSGNQLLNIIDDILEISRLETKQVKLVEEEVCLNDLLLELFAIFDLKAKENKTPLYFKKGCRDSECTIYTDSTKLVKIISNLLENALKFTTKGFVELGYKLVEKEQVKMLEIFVKDTGVGIKQKDINLIFERFSQAEKELSLQTGGLGLGLSIAKENTELLGGEIFVDSEFGTGTAFSILIPYKPANIELGPILNEDIIEKTILIAEDEEINFLYLETLIKDILDIKCNILHAKNGEHAINICKENSEIDIVLMDLKMPIINGYEATEQIRKFNLNIPIIAQTAYSTIRDKEKAKLSGCNDFISKPIDKKTLNSIIKKYINQE